MILHTLNKTQSNTELNQQLLIACSSNDSVLLIEDGLYQVLAPQLFSDKKHWSSKTSNVYALLEDAKARGIDFNKLDPQLEHIQFISYAEFVALAAEHNNTVSWY